MWLFFFPGKQNANLTGTKEWESTSDHISWSVSYPMNTHDISMVAIDIAI